MKILIDIDNPEQIKEVAQHIWDGSNRLRQRGSVDSDFLADVREGLRDYAMQAD